MAQLTEEERENLTQVRQLAKALQTGDPDVVDKQLAAMNDAAPRRSVRFGIPLGRKRNPNVQPRKRIG